MKVDSTDLSVIVNGCQDDPINNDDNGRGAVTAMEEYFEREMQIQKRMEMMRMTSLLKSKAASFMQR